MKSALAALQSYLLIGIFAIDLPVFDHIYNVLERFVWM